MKEEICGTAEQFPYVEPEVDFSPVAHLDLTNVEITEECKREVEAAR